MRGTVIHGTRGRPLRGAPGPDHRRADRRGRAHRRGLRVRLGPVALPRHPGGHPSRRRSGTSTSASSRPSAPTSPPCKPGQFVVGGFLTSDNTCPVCRAGACIANCLNGTGYDGCQAELIRDPERRRHAARHPGAPGRRPGAEPARPVRRDVHRLARRGLRRRAARAAPWWSSATARSACPGCWPPRSSAPSGSSR